IEGVKQALGAFSDVEILLYGQQEKIVAYIKPQDRLTIIHCAEVIEAEDDPVRSVRRKKDASMVRMAEAVKEGKADAAVSAGNTGALMSAGLFIVGRIDGVDRPALAPT